ncbi:hypothetical protein ACKKBF_B30705 [Auxenochlorella protothecoides x Auxenochlorella symbiontica]
MERDVVLEMTETCLNGMAKVHMETASLLAEIEAMSSHTCHVLDELKARFLERMDGMRSQVMEFVEQHESEWVQISAQTLTAQRKLAKVQGMVSGW